MGGADGANAVEDLAVRGSVLIVGPDGAGKSAIAEALAGAAARAGVQVVRGHWRPRVLLRSASDSVVTEPHAEAPRNTVASFAKLMVMALDSALGWLGPWRRAQSNGLLIFERGWWDQAVDPRRYRLPPVLLPVVRILGCVLPRADVVLLLRGEPELVAQRKRELPLAEIVRQQSEWFRLASRAGRVVVPLETVSTTREQTIATAAAALRRNLGGNQRWRRAHLAPARLDLRFSGGARAAPALAIYRTSKVQAHAAALVNRAIISTGAGTTVLPPIEDLDGLARLVGVDVDGAVAFRSAPPGRWVVGLAAAGCLHTVLKVGPNGDPALVREAEMLHRLAGLIEPFRVPTLRWVGEWRTHFVVATVMVPAGRRTRRIEVRDIVDPAVALARGLDESGPLVHGDFTSWNLLGTSSELTVLDWEASRDAFEPLVDIVHFVVQEAELLDRYGAETAVANLVAAESAGQTYCEQLGIGVKTARPLIRRALEREVQSPLVRTMLEQLG